MSGIFGVAAQTEKAQDYGYFAMYALQHRGQIGCGMAANKNGYIDYHKELVWSVRPLPASIYKN